MVRLLDCKILMLYYINIFIMQRHESPLLGYILYMIDIDIKCLFIYNLQFLAIFCYSLENLILKMNRGC